MAGPDLILKAAIICGMYNAGSAFVTDKLFLYNTATSTLKDHVCPTIDVLTTSSAISDLQCTFFCLLDVNCEGAFYHGGDNVCVLCSQYYDDTNGLDSYPGMESVQVARPVWAEWGSWSECSKSCGGGTWSRTRTCHPDSPLPCTGTGNTTDTEDCNTEDCPSYRTCADLAAQGMSQSGTATITPLENVNVAVYCDFDMEPGKVWTIMGHNREARTLVNGIEGCYEYAVYITYDIGLEAAKSVVDHSSECKQFIKHECKGSYCAAWDNRNNIRSTYFTGSPSSGKRCACGETGTCDNNQVHCNCDNNDDVWRYDEGFVTTRSDLPMTGFTAGDTGKSEVGPYMTMLFQQKPRNCSFKQAAVTRYLLKSDDDHNVEFACRSKVNPGRYRN